jgi:hypothetical protein
MICVRAIRAPEFASGVLAQRGSLMALNFSSFFPAARTQAAADDAGVGEHIVTVIAVALAILIVASIAVLMGMG